jgi:hypothetical protein
MTLTLHIKDPDRSITGVFHLTWTITGPRVVQASEARRAVFTGDPAVEIESTSCYDSIAAAAALMCISRLISLLAEYARSNYEEWISGPSLQGHI